MTTDEKLVQIVATTFNIPESSVTDELKYQEISQWDSISHMLLISQLEADFNIVIDTEDVIALSSIGKAKEILKKYIPN
jgi:acyl carrier protein